MKWQLSTPLLILLSTTQLFSQKLDFSDWHQMKARSIGPAGMSGRITSIDVVNGQPEIIYVGTASGGVWKSNSGGTNWKPIFDNQPVQSIGAVCIQQSNPDIIWVGTGEGNPRNSHNSGAGIYKSINNGRSWKFMGLENSKTIHRIIVDPTNPDRIFAATLGSAWGENPERGLYRSEDGGQSWDRILYVNNTTGCADLVMDPSNPNKLVAAMWEFRREPWFFKSGGEGSGLYISLDGGDSWKKRTEKHGLPKGELGRMGLAIAPSDPNVMYALLESKKLGLYRSDDGGYSWRLQSDRNVGNRPFYYADIFVDPENENRIYNLWSYVSVSEDGGKNFRTLLNYAAGIHPDHHAFWVHPEDPSYLIEGNDGGLNISRDRGKNWRFIENLPIGQFYHVRTDKATPYNIYGGMQDNGSWVGPAYVWRNGGIRNHEWQEVLFGDGFDVMPDQFNPDFVYAMYQGGSLYRINRITGQKEFIQPVHPEGKNLRFNWNAAMEADPFNPKAIFFGSQFVHYSRNGGKSWQILSPDLTTNDPEKQKQAESGGLTIDATKAENYTTITCIAPSPLDSNIIWVGTDDGRVWVTEDRGKTWSSRENRIPFVRSGAWINMIKPSTFDKEDAVIVINDYRRNDWNPYVYETENLGRSFKNVIFEYQVNTHCHSFIQDPEVENLWFLGTEEGLYISIDFGSNWTRYEHGIPACPIFDLSIQKEEGDLVLGTFGRSILILDDLNPLRDLARMKQELDNEPIHLFEPPTVYLAEYKEAEGTRFIADAHYSGENRIKGARFSFWLKEYDPKEMVDVFVFNEAGDTVRNFRIKGDTGIVRAHWDMRWNGVRMPGHHNISKKANLPGGQEVKPGSYTIKIAYQKQRDSIVIEVKADPRVDFDEELYRQKKELLNEHYKTIRAANLAFERLKKMRESIIDFNSFLSVGKDSTHKEVADMGKEIKKEIDSLMALFTTPKGFVGYDHVTVRLNNRLSDAQSYITNSRAPLNQMAKLSRQQAREACREILTGINELESGKWTDYREKIIAIGNVLPDFDPIELDE